VAAGILDVIFVVFVKNGKIRVGKVETEGSLSLIENQKESNPAVYPWNPKPGTATVYRGISERGADDR